MRNKTLSWAAVFALSVLIPDQLALAADAVVLPSRVEFHFSDGVEANKDVQSGLKKKKFKIYRSDQAEAASKIQSFLAQDKCLKDLSQSVLKIHESPELQKEMVAVAARRPGTTHVRFTYMKPPKCSVNDSPSLWYGGDCEENDEMTDKTFEKTPVLFLELTQVGKGEPLLIPFKPDPDRVKAAGKRVGTVDMRVPGINTEFFYDELRFVREVNKQFPCRLDPKRMADYLPVIAADFLKTLK